MVDRFFHVHYVHSYMTDNSIMFENLLNFAMEEAVNGRQEGGIPIGAVLADKNGSVIGRGHNRRIQNGDPSAHAETEAFRNAGRLRSYRETIMVTTLSPCWYCCGLIKQFRIGTVVIGESVNFMGGQDWLRDQGIRIIDLHSEECIRVLKEYIQKNPAVWNEDIGEV